MAAKIAAGGTGGSGGAAASTAHYITTQAEPSLTAEVVLGTAVIFAPNTLGNRPAASLAGRIYPCTTNGFIYRDNSATWDLIGTSLQLGTSGTTALAGNTALNAVTAPAADVSFNSHKATNVLDPTNPQDAATMAWVLTQIGSLDAKPECAYAATSALPACTYANGTLGVGATLTGNANGPLVVDSVTILVGQVGERVLVAGQASSFQNGWYTITQQGVVAVSPFILTRATESDQAAEVGPGYLTAIVAPSAFSAGSSNNGKVYVSLSNSPPVIGTDAITFSQVGTTYSAGTGLGLSGSTFSIDTATTVDKTTAQTLTGKRVTLRVETLTDAATVTAASDANDAGLLATLSQTTTIANPTGTPTNFQLYELRIKSTSSRTLSFGAQFRGGTDVALPASTTGSSKTDYYLFQWNSADSKWDIIAKVTGY